MAKFSFFDILYCCRISDSFSVRMLAVGFEMQMVGIENIIYEWDCVLFLGGHFKLQTSKIFVNFVFRLIFFFFCIKTDTEINEKKIVQKKRR